MSRPVVSRTVAAALIAAALAVPALPRVAAAETSNTSSIAQLMLLENGDRNFKNFHGAVWLEIDKQSYNYRWGGAQCGNKDLSETSIQILFAAFRSEYQVALEYTIFEVKGKEYRCITGFSVSKT